jgi:hypothetical protein
MEDTHSHPHSMVFRALVIEAVEEGSIAASTRLKEDIPAVI